MDKIKQQFLEDHKSDIQKGIWGLELDIRHLERQKITARDKELTSIDDVIRDSKARVKSYQSRRDLIDDVIKEDNN